MDMESNKFIRFSDLKNILCGVSRDTIYRWEKEGNFPKRVVMGKHFIVWKLKDIDNWITERQIGII